MVEKAIPPDVFPIGHDYFEAFEAVVKPKKGFGQKMEQPPGMNDLIAALEQARMDLREIGDLSDADSDERFWMARDAIARIDLVLESQGSDLPCTKGQV